MNVLFVCTANACRSPMAERLYRRMAAERRLAGHEARSAGLAAESFFQMPRAVRELLAREGTPVLQHTPASLTEDLVEWADAIYVMEEAQRRELVERFPRAWNKAGLLDPSGDIADPIGGKEEDYAACLERIRSRLECLLSPTQRV